jgi:hypothetical protein
VSRDGRDGRDGDDGKPGRPGRDGLSAFDIAVSLGFAGDHAAWIRSLAAADGAVGPAGPPGPPGPPGRDGTARSWSFEIIKDDAGEWTGVIATPLL